MHSRIACNVILQALVEFDLGKLFNGLGLVHTDVWTTYFFVIQYPANSLSNMTISAASEAATNSFAASPYPLASANASNAAFQGRI